MGKRRRMRWLPQGAHRVAVTRAAVPDGRLGASKRAAWPPGFAHSPQDRHPLLRDDLGVSRWRG
jgi:hypothetical protein